ncbi:MAG: hypothetical protein AAGC81_16290 [Pseudomonadota bacterium]
MRFLRTLSSLSALATAVLLGGASATSAAVLVTVNVNDPSAVIVSGTGANADVDLTVGSTLGPALLDFFSVDFNLQGVFAQDFSSTLTVDVFAVGDALATLGGLSIQGIGSDVENDVVLSFVADAEFPGLVYSTSSPAITGSAVYDLSPLAVFLPTAGQSGDILGFDSVGGTPQVIGQYQVVVPVPGAALLLLPALAVFPLLRRRFGAD